MKAYYLTEDDAVILRKVLQEYRNHDRSFGDSVQIPRHPHAIEEMGGYPSDDIFTPECYVIEIPRNGIPAAEIDEEGHFIPGEADCDVYKTWPLNEDEEELVKTHFDHKIHNLSQESIQGSSEETGTGSGTGTTEGSGKFQLAWRDKFGTWFTSKTVSNQLVELCALEEAERNIPYECLLGTWNPDVQLWCYDNAETVWAIDHRKGAPHAEEGWKGLYQEMPSNNPDHDGKIYICVSLDCSTPEEGCTCES